MSNIQPYLDKIKSAVYGEEVRDSIHDAIETSHACAVTAQNSAIINAATAAQKASEALTEAEKAVEASKSAAESAERAKTFAQNVEAIADASIATQDAAGFMRGGDNYVDESGALTLTKTTTERTLLNSYAGGLKINEILGESEQISTTGAQLFDKDNLTGQGGYYDMDGIFRPNQNWVYQDIPVNGNTALFQSGLTSPTTTPIVGAYKEGVFIGGIEDYKSSILDIPNDADTIRVNVRTADLETYMLNVGNKALPWEPYTGGAASPNPSYPQENNSSVINKIVVQNKNLLKNTASSKTINGITFIAHEDGSMTANGTATGLVGLAIGSFTYVGGKTYLLSGCPNGGSNSTYKIKATESGSINDFGDGAKVIYDTDRTDTISIIIYSGVTVSNLTFRPMISEVGGEYEPYQSKAISLSEPITLHGIGDFKDRIVKRDGVWGIERNVGVLTLKGTENWVGSGTAFDNCVALNMAVGNKLSGWQQIKSNIFRSMSQADYNSADAEGIGGYSTMITVKLLKNRLGDFNGTNAEAVPVFKEYLAKLYAEGKPAVIHYPLSESIFVELPVVDQTALYTLITYDDVTHLITDSTVEPVIEVEYGTSKVGAMALLNELHNSIQDIATKNLSDNLSAEIAELKTKITSLAAEQTWHEGEGGKGHTATSLKTTTGDILELRLAADIVDGDESIYLEIPILSLEMTVGETKHYRSGYAINSVYSGMVSFAVAAGQGFFAIELEWAHLNGEDITANTEWKFYYRKKAYNTVFPPVQ